MAKLWTDVIDPATLTGYARAALADYEASKGTLARWLPNREVPGIVVRFVKGATGLIDVAKYRAYDAELEKGKRPSAKRVTLELPALGQEIPVSEYEQLRLNGPVSEEQALAAIQNTTRIVARAVSDSVERMRGVVLATGKATIDQDNYKSEDDFARPAGHQLTAASLWTASNVSRLEYLQQITDTYSDTNGADAGAILMSRRVFRALAQGDEFQTQLVNGAARPATEDQVRGLISSAGLPDIYVYDRRVSVDGVATRVLPDDGLLLLPTPVDTDDWQGTELGATFWGQTLTATDADWDIEPGEQPGLVTGVYRHEKPPMGLEVISDAIALPVLANAELSLYAKVL